MHLLLFRLNISEQYHKIFYTVKPTAFVLSSYEFLAPLDPLRGLGERKHISMQGSSGYVLFLCADATAE